MSDKKYLSAAELEINKIIKDTAADIAKLEADIKNYKLGGPLQLNYNPPGVGNINRQRMMKDIGILQDTIETFREGALVKIDGLVSQLPPDEQNKIRENISQKLSPWESKHFSPSRFMNNNNDLDRIKESRDSKNGPMKEWYAVTTEFYQSLQSKFLQKQNPPIQEQKGQQKNPEFGLEERQ